MMMTMVTMKAVVVCRAQSSLKAGMRCSVACACGGCMQGAESLLPCGDAECDCNRV